jgi:subtilisin family serine protease
MAPSILGILMTLQLAAGGPSIGPPVARLSTRSVGNTNQAAAPSLPPPAAWADRDGPWPSAGKTVFRIEDAAAATAAGLPSTRRPGWFVLDDADVAAGTARAKAAASLARYTTPAFFDRLGGLAWPDAAILVGLRKTATEADRAAALALVGGTAERYAALPDLALVRLDVASGREVLARTAAIASHPAVAFAEPDLAITGRHSLVPTDPLFPESWGHRNTGQAGGIVGFDMGSTVAWDRGTGDAAIKVLVIDTGVESSHPDLNVAPGRDFTTGAVNGVPGGDPANQYESHGTAVAGCISGRIDNGLGTCGIAPSCPTVSARCFVGLSGGSWDANYSWTANALNWALANGVLVTNNSNWYGGTSAAVEAAYAATREAGTIHFASAGNTGNTAVTYPASLAPVIAVGAAQRTGTRASFSCYGPMLDCLAPGSAITTTDRTGSIGYTTGDFASVSGTSFASPLAAGLAALMRSGNPGLTPDEITSVLFSTARDMGLAGFDTGTGWGLLDAAAAVAAVTSGCPADLDGDGVIGPSDLTILLGAWGVPAGDIDGNGDTGPSDLTLLLSSWGPCGG